MLPIKQALKAPFPNAVSPSLVANKCKFESASLFFEPHPWQIECRLKIIFSALDLSYSRHAELISAAAATQM